jgi:hypothetical protein
LVANNPFPMQFLLVRTLPYHARAPNLVCSIVRAPPVAP